MAVITIEAPKVIIIGEEQITDIIWTKNLSEKTIIVKMNTGNGEVMGKDLIEGIERN